MDKDYTNREISHYFGEVNETLERIETQVKQTNGRVTKLESWQSFIKGGLTILSILVVPILLYIISQFISK